VQQLPLFLCGFFLLATLITAFVSVTHNSKARNVKVPYAHHWGEASKIFAVLFVASVWMAKLSIGPRYTGLILILMLFSVVAAVMTLTKSGNLQGTGITQWNPDWFGNAGIAFLILVFASIWLSLREDHLVNIYNIP
jgi:hypothetical protein